MVHVAVAVPVPVPFTVIAAVCGAGGAGLIVKMNDQVSPAWAPVTDFVTVTPPRAVLTNEQVVVRFAPGVAPAEQVLLDCFHPAGTVSVTVYWTPGLP